MGNRQNHKIWFHVVGMLVLCHLSDCFCNKNLWSHRFKPADWGLGVCEISLANGRKLRARKRMKLWCHDTLQRENMRQLEMST